MYVYIWGLPKIRATAVGVHIIRTIVSWGLYWVPPIQGNYHMYLCMYVPYFKSNIDIYSGAPTTTVSTVSRLMKPLALSKVETTGP